jgi:hypothetical protein
MRAFTFVTLYARCRPIRRGSHGRRPPASTATSSRTNPRAPASTTIGVHSKLNVKVTIVSEWQTPVPFDPLLRVSPRPLLSAPCCIVLQTVALCSKSDEAKPVRSFSIPFLSFPFLSFPSVTQPLCSQWPQRINHSKAPQLTQPAKEGRPQLW